MNWKYTWFDFKYLQISLDENFNNDKLNNSNFIISECL